MPRHAPPSSSLPVALLFAAATGAAQAQLAPSEFAVCDTNHDGRVSAGEYEGYARILFDQMDEDPDDDRLTPAEIRANADTFFRHVYAGSNILGPADLTDKEKIQRLDANQDGIISQTEYLAGAAAKFQKLDSNHDGDLDPDEFNG